MDRNQMVGPDGEVLGAVEDENAVSYFLIRSKHFLLYRYFFSARKSSFGTENRR